MRRRSFTPRFASKTIRSLAHFHAAEDEGKALVCKGRFRALHLNESVRPISELTRRSRARCFFFEDGITRTPNVTSPDTMLSRSEWSRYNVPSFEACLSTMNTLWGTGSRAAHPRRNPRVFVAMCRIAAAGSSVARLLLFAA